MSMFDYLKIPDIILSLFLHKNWTGLILLAPTVNLRHLSNNFKYYLGNIFPLTDSKSIE